MFNKTLLIGNLTNNVEFVGNDDGKVRAVLNLATNTFWYVEGERQQTTDFHRVVAFGPQAQRVKDLKKGQQIFVRGPQPDPPLRARRRDPVWCEKLAEQTMGRLMAPYGIQRSSSRRPQTPALHCCDQQLTLSSKVRSPPEEAVSYHPGGYCQPARRVPN